MKHLINLVVVISLLSCSKKDDFISQIEQIKKDTITTPITPSKKYTLYKESYLNQRSGMSFWWYDNLKPAWPYISLVDVWLDNTNNYHQWYGNCAYYDVNNDGYQDILTAYFNQGTQYATSNDTPPQLVWLINNGDNFHFTKSTQYFNQNTDEIRAHKILKTDVNNDNIVDFILLGVIESPGNYGGNFTVLIGKPNGTFDINRIPNPTKYWFHNGACGDLNGDGFVDVITATFIWLGDGKGNFIKTDNSDTKDYFGNILGYIKSPLVYEILDINKDGWNDLIMNGPFQNTTIVLNNKGVFDRNNEKIVLPNVEFKVVLDLEFTDFDKDGDLDILELAQKGGGPPNVFDAQYVTSKITVYYNNNLTFTADENLLSESLDGNYLNGEWDKYGWSMFKLDDLDGDGVDEIVSETYQEGTYNALKKVGQNWKKTTIKFGK
jgi:frataxin-like iron-binding protein CyaY